MSNATTTEAINSLTQTLNMLETYKSDLSKVTVAQVLESFNYLTSQQILQYGAAYGLTAASVDEAKAYYAAYPSSTTLYDLLKKNLTDQIENLKNSSADNSGNSSNDTSSGSWNNFIGTDNADTYAGTSGKDSIIGGGGNDTLSAGAGNDVVYGGDGNDLIDGGEGKDKIFGGAGDDTLNGGQGSDTMEGGEGSDTYYVDNSKDKVTDVKNSAPATSSTPTLPIDIGSSIDTVIASIKYTLGNYVENLTLTGTGNLAGTGNTENNTLTGNSGNNTLNGKGGNDSLDGGAGNDNLTGDVGNDTLVGGDGVDKLTGGAGNDSLNGGAGNDTLDAGAGADTLIGGAGADKLTGGADADIFVLAYLNTVDADADLITDFTDADVLKFDPKVFVSLSGGITAGNLAVDKKTADLDANDYLIFDSKTGSLYYDADGSGTTASAIKIAGIKGADAKATTFAFDDLQLF